MGYVRLLIGAIVGAAIGAALWILVQFYMEREFGWLAIGVGLLAGLFAKQASGKASLGYARGAIPTIATLIFIILVHYALFGLLQATGGPRGHTALAQPGDDSIAAADSTGGTNAGGLEPLADLTRGRLDGVGTQGMRRAKDPFSWGTFLWIGIAALVAYVVGGSDPTEMAELSAESALDAPTTDISPEPTVGPPATEDEP